jgi:CRP/FNR family transcriptional regulator, anaerobic regulatory protein
LDRVANRLNAIAIQLQLIALWRNFQPNDKPVNAWIPGQGMMPDADQLYENLFTSWEKFLVLTPEERAAFMQASEVHHFKKGKVLVRQGHVCDKFFFVLKGAVRTYRRVGSKELTHGLQFDRCDAVALSSFISRAPSQESIELLEDSILISISRDNLQRLYMTYPRSNMIGRLGVEEAFVELEGRTRSLQQLSAKERYEELIARSPECLQRVALKHIASYLGITQETLSRIRAST